MSQDIKTWLRALGLGQYCDVFAAGDVDLRVLLHLTEPDLRELGYRSDTAKSSWRRLPMITPNARSERGSRP